MYQGNPAVSEEGWRPAKRKWKLIGIAQIMLTLSVMIAAFSAKSSAPAADSPVNTITAYLVTWDATAEGHGAITVAPNVGVPGLSRQEDIWRRYSGHANGRAIIRFSSVAGTKPVVGGAYAAIKDVHVLESELSETFEESHAFTSNFQGSCNSYLRQEITNPNANAGSYVKDLIGSIDKGADGFLRMEFTSYWWPMRFTTHSLFYSFNETYFSNGVGPYVQSCGQDREYVDPLFVPWILEGVTWWVSGQGKPILKATTAGDAPAGFYVRVGRTWPHAIPISPPQEIVGTHSEGQRVIPGESHEEWMFGAHRLGACAEHDSPLQDGDPVIQDEDVTISTKSYPKDITPDGETKLHVKVTCDLVPVEKAEVQLTVKPEEGSGGHDHSSNRPRGKLNDTELTNQTETCKFGQVQHPCIKVKTDKNGDAIIKFIPPLKYKFPDRSSSKTAGIAGIYTATAKSTRFPTRMAKTPINVKFDLEQLPDATNANYEICGRSDPAAGGGCKPGQPGVGKRGTNEHKDGMWGTTGTLAAFQNLANDFWQSEQRAKQELQQCKPKPKDMVVRKLSINDIALPWGGKFDLGQHWGQDWHESHQTHGAGTGGDVNHFKESSIYEDCTGIVHEKWDDFWMDVLLSLGLNYGHWDQYDQNQPNKELHLHVED